jgi:hypothetical protein
MLLTTRISLPLVTSSLACGKLCLSRQAHAISVVARLAHHELLPDSPLVLAGAPRTLVAIMELNTDDRELQVRDHYTF